MADQQRLSKVTRAKSRPQYSPESMWTSYRDHRWRCDHLLFRMPLFGPWGAHTRHRYVLRCSTLVGANLRMFVGFGPVRWHHIRLVCVSILLS